MTNILTTEEQINEIAVSTKIENIKIYISDANGTGKTWAIKEDIKKLQLDYKYLPIGGFLDKKKIPESKK